MSRLYGLFADLHQRPVLVVGGGAIAERKIESLLLAGASITVVSHQFSEAIQAWQQEGKLSTKLGDFHETMLDTVFLTIAATDDHTLNQRIAKAAEERHRLVNVVDTADLCNFHVPSIIDRGLLQIAISTAGAAPALGRRIRADIEQRLDRSIGALIALSARFRQPIKKAFPKLNERREFYERLPESLVAAHLKRNDEEQAAQALSAMLEKQSITLGTQKGFVTLVGAGPGDAGLLTLHGFQALQSADVVLYDQLVSKDVLQLIRRDAETICVGKAAGKHSYTQEAIQELLVQQAKRGLQVVRLKGGDPFIFGRGGEELQYLKQHDIAYRVIPGITAASACAAYSGIPLTHRDYAQSVRFVTAHCKNSEDNVDWVSLASSNQTLAVYMGVAQLQKFRDKLVTHGRSLSTPFAIVENGSRLNQRVITGTLGNLPETAKRKQVQSPALLLLGEVTALAEQLAWFNPRLNTPISEDQLAETAQQYAAQS